METMALPGLERLLDVCQRLDLGLQTSPPAREPLRAGCLLEGVPFDPVLASVYARLGHAVFATRLMGPAIYQSSNEEHGLEKINKDWRGKWWEELGTPVLVFGGAVYTYATVPALADERGRQPVVEINTYELDGLHVMPVASNVDCFFDTYACYLEAMVKDPDDLDAGRKRLIFPWNATEILARDERLVELMRAGSFDPLMKDADDETRRWASTVMGSQA
jgi:hypothetical protein